MSEELVMDASAAGELAARFEGWYGGGAAAGAVRAPGRVNLIGEHTDYNDGFVLPIAIEKEIVALVRARGDEQVLLRSTGADGQVAVELGGEIAPAEPKWANYCRGVIAGLAARGEALVGAEILFDSTIPLGAGLSSSAALEVATAMALQAAAGTVGAIPPRELALLCQHAEHTFAGTPCGIMDQSIVIMGEAGRALLLDCRSGETRQVPFDDPALVLLVCDTQVKHELNDGGYAARRAQCESAAEKMGIPALRDATAEQVASAELTDVERMRARHVVGEIARTVRAVEVLGAGDYAEFGRLMYTSHDSLRDDYQVSCAELDAIVEIAADCDGVYGARMTGGGFGGSAIVLVSAAAAEVTAAAIAAGFAERFGQPCPVFATRAAAGASLV